MRKLKLWNRDKTQIINLNARENLATNWQGLGLDYNLTFAETNEGGYLENKKISNKDIKCTIIFGLNSNAYQNYNSFNDVIRNSNNNLILEYNDGIKTLYRDVSVRSLTKNEKDNFNLLKCELTLMPIGGWYFDDVIRFIAPGAETEPGWDFSRIKGEKHIKIEINFFLETAGLISLLDLEIGLETSSEKFPFIRFSSVDIGHGLNDTIVIDGIKKEMYLLIWDIQYGRTVKNIYGTHDFDYQSFMVIPDVGLPDGLHFYVTFIDSSGNENTGNVKITIRRYV